MSVRDPLGNVCNWKVKLHFRSLGTPRVPEFTALKNAQAAYGQYGIFIQFGSGQSEMNATHFENQCLSLQNVDVGTCTLRQSMTLQQDAMFGEHNRVGVGRNDILCFWVDRVQSGTSQLAGCASHPTALPACVVSALGSPWTLAHEVGHVLGLRHTTGATMMMSTPTASITANPPSMSASDISTIRTSRCCVPC